MMNVYFFNLWNKLKASFWLVPIMMIFLILGLFFITLKLDRVLDHYTFSNHPIWQGDPEAARQLLSTIARSIITITGVVFSLTIVSLSLISTQFGSRLLRNFVQDFATQFILGTFISTSIYSLLVLKIVREDFIPNISITVSLIFGIVSLVLLIFFIHHLAIRVQAGDIIARVGEDLISTIENSLEDSKEGEVEAFDQERECQEAIFSKRMGYLQAIDYHKLHKLANKNDFKMEIDIRPGRFIRKGMILAKINKKNLTKNMNRKLRNSFIIGKGKSPIQDIEFAIDQLVVVALRALGVNANDTFTANSCLDRLGAALVVLCQKKLLPPYYRPNGHIKLFSKQLNYEGLVDASFNQIRQYGHRSPSVLIRLLEVLSFILPNAQNEKQREALRKHAVMVSRAGEAIKEERDRKDIEKRYEQFNNHYRSKSI